MSRRRMGSNDHYPESISSQPVYLLPSSQPMYTLPKSGIYAQRTVNRGHRFIQSQASFYDTNIWGERVLSLQWNVKRKQSEVCWIRQPQCRDKPSTHQVQGSQEVLVFTRKVKPCEPEIPAPFLGIVDFTLYSETWPILGWISLVALNHANLKLPAPHKWKKTFLWCSDAEVHRELQLWMEKSHSWTEFNVLIFRCQN